MILKHANEFIKYLLVLILCLGIGLIFDNGELTLTPLLAYGVGIAVARNFNRKKRNNTDTNVNDMNE